MGEFLAIEGLRKGRAVLQLTFPFPSFPASLFDLCSSFVKDFLLVPFFPRFQLSPFPFPFWASEALGSQAPLPEGGGRARPPPQAPLPGEGGRVAGS